MHFAANMEFLVSHRKRDATMFPANIESWIQSLSGRHREQLGELGLIGRFDSSLTVQQLIDAFLEEYEAKPNDEIRESTKRQFRSAMENRIPRRLLDKRLIDLEPKREHHRPNAEAVFSKEAKAIFKDCESWQRNHYAKSSWSRANGRIREIGVWAVKNGICDYNPFTLLPKPGETNPDRNVYVEQVWVDDAMDMCIDADTRLVFALGRYAGFRLPSESRTLKWEHVDFKKSKLRVFDSKKRQFREMPLFDRIRDELLKHRESVEPGRFVLSERTRTCSDANNFSLMKEAIARTEHSQWEKLRQNLRASCENDLLNQGFDERLVTVWLGHTVKISRMHYQKQTDADLINAVHRNRRLNDSTSDLGEDTQNA